MVTVQFTRHLLRFFPDLRETELEARTVRELVDELEVQYPGIAAYLVDDDGALRKHVNVFIEKDMIRDRHTLTDPIAEQSTVSIIQALSGG